MTNALAIAAAIALFAALEGAFHLVRWLGDRRSRELRRRLQSVGNGSSELGMLRKGRLAASPAMDAFLRSLPLTARAEKLLEQADSRWTVAQLLSYSALASCGGLLVAVTIRGPAVLGLIFAIIGAAIPTLYVIVSRDRRSRKLSEQLPDALDMMARSLRAGHALSGAFELVAREMPDPIRIEFARAYEEQRLGLSLERAVLQMSLRAPSNGDLKLFAVSAIIQRETGGNLAEILEKIGETVRARYRFKGKLRALTAEGRASAVVVGVLPIGMMAFLLTVNPDYVQELFNDPIGHRILGAGTVSWFLGIVWLRKMTALEL